MALSEQERQILDQMERELRIQDPDLASTMSIESSRPERPARKGYSPRRVAAGIVIAVVGLILPLVAISIGIMWLTILMGAVGFALMLAGVLMVAVPTEKSTSLKKASRPSGSFMDRQQQKWEERKR